MKKFLLLSLLTIGFSSVAQTKETIKDFNWIITIPQSYARSSEEPIDDQDVKLLLKYEKDPAHYIEAYSETFDEKTDGNYKEAATSAKKEATDTANQMLPGSATLTETETIINGLKFLTFTTKIVADANFSLYTKTFTRLFGKKTLTINLVYAQESEGDRLSEAVMNSTLKK